MKQNKLFVIIALIFLSIVLFTFIIIISEANSTLSTSTTTSHSHLLIAEVYPNTFTKNDLEEYIAISNPSSYPVNIKGWSLTDGEGKIIFPYFTIQPEERIYVTRTASVFIEKITPMKSILPDFEYGTDSDSNVTQMQGKVILLCNEGDEVILKNEKGEAVDVVIYGDSLYEGEGWKGEAVRKPREGIAIKRKHAIDTDTKEDFLLLHPRMPYFPPKNFSFSGFASITAFISPDSSFSTLRSEINKSSSSLYLNFYEFENLYIMDYVIDAMNRGVKVYLLLEDNPVGGISPEESYISLKIKEKGGEVHFSNSTFNHAKYAIIDNKTAIVMSENCGLTGFSPDNSYGNRGWGIVIRNEEVASYLKNVYFADFKISKNLSLMLNEGGDFGKGEEQIQKIMPEGSYNPVFDAFTPYNNATITVTPILAPDTAVSEILCMLNSASKSIYVEMFSAQRFWDEGENPFISAVVEAARRGCEVKVLLDSKDYNLKDWNDNDEVALYINEVAKRENLSLEARLASLNSNGNGLVKIHNKGLIVDGKKTLISSLNWNAHSIYNREAGVIVESEEIGEFYTEVFFHDWNIPAEMKEEEGGEKEVYMYTKILYVVLTLIITYVIFLVVRLYKRA